MSGKIKSKDLSYDSTLPPFLQRMRAQHTGQGDADRHEQPIARPKKQKDPNDDDGPTVVDASGDILTKDQYEKLASEPQKPDLDNGPLVPSGVDAEQRTSSAQSASGNETLVKVAPRRDQNITSGTAQKKRKAVKIVGDEDEQGDDSAEGKESQKKVVKHPKKKSKSKPIKLNFDDEQT